jgi:diadenosine tetraphosphate (Ap4A) HIT family hydrolase
MWHGAADQSFDCETCGFGLWRPILRLSESEVGLYSDSRFVGRCIVTMQDHFEQIHEVPAMKLVTFMEEIQFCVEAIKRVTECDRVNVAILGNAESHVHAHLIPRRPEAEPFPRKAPWEDDRPKAALPRDQEQRVMLLIREELENLLRYAPNRPVRLEGRRRPTRMAKSENALTLFDLLSDEGGNE